MARAVTLKHFVALSSMFLCVGTAAKSSFRCLLFVSEELGVGISR